MCNLNNLVHCLTKYAGSVKEMFDRDAKSKLNYFFLIIMWALLLYLANLCFVAGMRLWYASMQGNVEMIFSALKKGVSLNYRNPELHLRQSAYKNCTPLIVASGEGHTSAVNFLLLCGSDVNAEASGMTSLHFASRNGHDLVVKLLLGGGANINQTDGDDRTSLHLASLWGHPSVVRLLLERGADAGIRNKYGDTPLGEVQSEEVKKVFQELGIH